MSHSMQCILLPMSLVEGARDVGNMIEVTACRLAKYTQACIPSTHARVHAHTRLGAQARRVSGRPRARMGPSLSQDPQVVAPGCLTQTQISTTTHARIRLLLKRNGTVLQLVPLSRHSGIHMIYSVVPHRQRCRYWSTVRLINVCNTHQGSYGSPNEHTCVPSYKRVLSSQARSVVTAASGGVKKVMQLVAAYMQHAMNIYAGATSLASQEEVL